MAQTVTDLFEKARTHERLEVLRAAREHDLVPFFRLMEGEAGPVVRMVLEVTHLDGILLADGDADPAAPAVQP
jgi:hypothetical protein